MNVAAAEISVDEVERQAVAPQIFEDFIDRFHDNPNIIYNLKNDKLKIYDEGLQTL